MCDGDVAEAAARPPVSILKTRKKFHRCAEYGIYDLKKKDRLIQTTSISFQDICEALHN